MGTWMRTVVMALALLNEVLTLLGWNPLSYSEEEFYQALTAVSTVVASVWAWWKNNSFTPAAIAGDRVMQKMKQAQKRGI